MVMHSDALYCVLCCEQHRVVMNLPGYMSSVISFVRGKELKQELNEKFRQKVTQPISQQLIRYNGTQQLYHIILYDR